MGGLVAATGGDAKQVTTGAIAGAGVGCGAAYLYKKRVDRLNAVAKQNGIDAEVSKIVSIDSAGNKEEVGIEAVVQSQEMFPSGSYELTAKGREQLRAMASEFAAPYLEAANKNATAPTTKVLVVGHSDSSGGATTNQVLSEKRARAVGQILADAGIPKANIYFQGAGSSRPTADNSTTEGRAKNRRVELVEVTDEAMLIKRVQHERSNTKYLTHSTSTKPAVAEPTKVTKPAAPVVSTKPVEKNAPSAGIPAVVEQAASAKSAPTAAPAVLKHSGKGGIDFGGKPVTDTYSKLTSNIAPKSSGFALISRAYADAPVVACVVDMPRLSGDVINLETNTALSDYSTTDFLPGLNGRVWANVVNGHVATVGPVGILRDNAKVAVEPKLQFITNVKTSKQKQTPAYKAVANTYEGEHQVLYRVFATDQANSPVACMDVVYDKRSGNATAGEIYYAKGGEAYVADFTPVRR